MTDLSGGCAWVRGEFVPAREASVPILDWGFLHSDATYDVVSVWDGAFFRLEDHLDRFEASMAALRLDVPMDRAAITEILTACVVKAGLKHAYVEMIATRGLSAPGSRDPRSCTNTFMAFAIPYMWVADPEKQKIGLDAHIATVNRINPASVDPTVKNYHWLDMTMALFEAYDQGHETAILTDGAGNVVEGPGFNVFIVEGDHVATPKRGVLHGITRKSAIELAAKAGLSVAERAVSVADVCAADEVFVSTTGGGFIPITRINGQPIGDGTPGLITLDLTQQYWNLHSDPAFVTPIAYASPAE